MKHKPKPLQPTLIRLTDPQINALRQYSKRTGVPQSEVMRRALELYLKHTKGKLHAKASA